jgi:hypothetical protein
MQCKDINIDLIRNNFEKIIIGLENSINKKETIHYVEINI